MTNASVIGDACATILSLYASHRFLRTVAGGVTLKLTLTRDEEEVSSRPVRASRAEP